MKETLEAAAEQYKKSTVNKMVIEKMAFIEGAKWQSERMVTEEDMKKAFEAGEYSKEDEINGDGAMDFKEWFLEFKKGQ